ncbi:hypothetical protein MLD38_039869 [Melastoma candidum]|uniref:Uncharacterized protein n=1 Tax=Melastoma candidum TaxID=119954 RepID=A0ACB9L529_9MYRT|nr:hypothetical protein MLD38_039869 [Melastoma candidum]
MGMKEGSRGENSNYWGDIDEEEYYKQQGIQSTKSFFITQRGLTLFSRSWRPLPSSPPPRGVVLMLHGYANDVSWTFQSTPIFLASRGYACFAFDLEGHGRSQGLRAFVPDVDLVVQDAISYFGDVRRDPSLQGLPCFIYGESMGGAIALLIHLADLKGWFRGAVLVAPMCKINDKVRPRWPIPQILSMVARVLPTLPIVPAADLVDKSVRIEEKREVALMNPMRYKGKPRLGTVLELLRVTDHLSSNLSRVSIPFIVLHGSADVVTDPDVSRALYEEAQSEDKTIRIYEGMMHSLLFGETEENIDMVRNDIVSWLDQRCNNI